MLLVARGLVLAWFAVLFLQSGLDKFTDRAGNLEWLTGHFKASPLAKLVPFMLTTVTILEVASGLSCAAGVVLLAMGKGIQVGAVGLVLASASLLSLFFGQRLAKDYAGAAALVPYFTLALIGLVLLAN